MMRDMEIQSQTSSSYSSFNNNINASIFPLISHAKMHGINPSDDQWFRFLGNMEDSCGTEWKDIESRFDRLASTSKLIKCSDFGICIGMEQSLEFANELLRALRGIRMGDITKEQLYEYWRRLSYPCFDSRIRIFFDLFDTNMDGKITELDIKQTVLLSACTNKLSISQAEAETYASLVMEYLDSEKRGHIEINEFSTLFRISLTKGSMGNRKHEEVEEKSWSSLMSVLRWRRLWVLVLWLVLCTVLFTWKFIQYRHRRAFQVMGYCVCTAKGAAETLKLNMALVLLPVCRNTITWLRSSTRMGSTIPFNDNINFHKVIAGGIVVGVILHGGTHLACDLPRICGSDSAVFDRILGPGFGFHQPSYLQILGSTEVASGIVMVVLMCVAFGLAAKSLRHVTGYNPFWYSHHLFIPVYALLIIHSMFLFLTDRVAEKTTWMYLAIPILIYVGERSLRAIRSGSCEVQILQATFYPGKVLSLKLNKPKGFRYQSGMYIFIQCPQISTFEWHPFSLTSGPEDDHLSVHIRSLGDWSYKTYNLFQEVTLCGGAKEYPKIHIDGPYGAASQDHVKYDIVVLIGLGIGATPFISILKDVVHGITRNTRNGRYDAKKGPIKAYMYWVTREACSFEWFRDAMKEISKIDQKQSVIEVHNFLSSIYSEGDSRSALISVIQALHYSKHGIDLVSQTPLRTHFGRPNWLSIFSNLGWRHRGAKIGVFYCGPSALAKDIERLCTKFSSKTTTRFVFHKETYY